MSRERQPIELHKEDSERHDLVKSDTGTRLNLVDLSKAGTIEKAEPHPPFGSTKERTSLAKGSTSKAQELRGLPFDFSSESSRPADLFRDGKSATLFGSNADSSVTQTLQLSNLPDLLQPKDGLSSLGFNSDQFLLKLLGDSTGFKNGLTPVADVSRVGDVLTPGYHLSEANRLQRHLETRDDGSGGKEFFVKKEVVDADGTRHVVTDSPQSLKRKIGQSYWSALQTAADSEPARKEELAQIEKNLEAAKKLSGFDKIPTLKELEAMTPEELAKRSPEQQDALKEMRALLERKQDLENSSLAKAIEQYKKYLDDTKQESALKRFELYEPLLATMPFQNWLDQTGNSVRGQLNFENLTVAEEDNPFSYQQKAAEALRQGNTEMAERYLKRAVECAQNISPEQIKAEMKRVKDEQAKLDPNSAEFQSLTAQQDQLRLLMAAPGLMQTAYADYLARSGKTDEAFVQLSLASSNHLALALINGRNDSTQQQGDSSQQQEGYFEKLVNLCVHGNKEMVDSGRVAATQLQAFSEHLKRAAELSSSSNPEDQQKAEAEYRAARDAAAAASKACEGVNANDCARNAELIAAAIRAEEDIKPPQQKDEKKIAELKEQQKLYTSLSHLPALAAVCQATAESGIAADGELANAEKRAKIRELLQTAQIDHHLSSEVQAQLDGLEEESREKEWPERTAQWFRRNAGTFAAITAGTVVTGLTCWSGPGAALAGGMTAGAVAGALADGAAGNEVTTWTVGQHAFEAFGGGVSGLVRGKMLASAGKVLSHPAVAGATASGAGSAVEHFPTLITQGPGAYLPEVAWSAGTGGAVRGSILGRARKLAPVVPGLSHALKEGIRTAVEGERETHQ